MFETVMELLAAFDLSALGGLLEAGRGVIEGGRDVLEAGRRTP